LARALARSYRKRTIRANMAIPQVPRRLIAAARPACDTSVAAGGFGTFAVSMVRAAGKSNRHPIIMFANFKAFWRARSELGFAGVLPFGWTGMVIVALTAIVVSCLLFGYRHPYWRSADMDFMMVYQGFLLNDGRAQEYFDHPGHLTILLLDGWFRLLHHFGALDVIALSDIPPATDVAGFDRAFQAAVRAGRLLSMLLAVAIVGAFAVLLRRLIADWRVAALATLLLALSSGVIWQAHLVRTELLGAGLADLGLLLLLLAARSPAWRWRALGIGVAAMLCTLGIVNKVQTIFLAAALPLVVVWFGVRSDSADSMWRSLARARVPIGALALLFAALATPAYHLVETGFLERAALAPNLRPPPFGVLGLYQAALAGWIGASVVGFAAIWRVPPLETVATLLAITLGVCIGLLSLEFRYHPQAVIAVINPIETMFAWGMYADPGLVKSEGILSLQLLSVLLHGFLDVLARLTFVLHSSSRATVFLEWVVLAGLVVAWRRGQRLLVAQVASLIVLSWALDTIGTLRGLQLTYAMYSDPLIVVAAAWLFTNLPELGTYRHALAVAVALVAIHVLASQTEPIRQGFRRTPNLEVCVWLPHYLLQIERFPFCPPRN
jgi:hypothetical protein